MTDSDVFSQIIGNYSGVTPNGRPLPLRPNTAELVQYYSNDWDFTMTRADLTAW